MDMWGDDLKEYRSPALDIGSNIMTLSIGFSNLDSFLRQLTGSLVANIGKYTITCRILV